nr:MAG TPA: hypothetical protein [Caudoviricetes sp.]
MNAIVSGILQAIKSYKFHEKVVNSYSIPTFQE